VEEAVNLVSARAVAEGRGIRISESADSSTGDYTNLLTVTATPGSSVSGTTIGTDNRLWLVGVGGYQVEIELDTHMLVMINDDRPGMIGSVGTLLGAEGVNIANMNVSRNTRGEPAVMVLTVDSVLSAASLEHLRAEPGIQSARFVSLEGA
jgi:D-3-phosphoglycerate dehydrogenase